MTIEQTSLTPVTVFSYPIVRPIPRNPGIGPVRKRNREPVSIIVSKIPSTLGTVLYCQAMLLLKIQTSTEKSAPAKKLRFKPIKANFLAWCLFPWLNASVTSVLITCPTARKDVQD